MRTFILSIGPVVLIPIATVRTSTAEILSTRSARCRDCQLLAKFKSVGVSNMGISNFDELIPDPSCKVVPTVNYIELHLAIPQSKHLAYSAAKGICSTAYSPLRSTDSKLCSDDTATVSRSKVTAGSHGRFSLAMASRERVALVEQWLARLSQEPSVQSPIRYGTNKTSGL